MAGVFRSLRLFTTFLLVGVLALAASSTIANAFGPLHVINPVGGGPDDVTYQLDTPTAIIRAVDGTFYVADSSNNRVVKLSADGEFLFAFGGNSSADAGTRSPLSLAFAPTGSTPDILVGTSSDGIKRFDPDGNFIEKFGAGSVSGSFIGVDPSCGELFVSEGGGQHRVRRFALGDNPLTPGTTEQFGDLLETFGDGATGIGQPGLLWTPRGLGFDSTGRVFVTDLANFRVQVYKWSGNCGSRTHAYDKYLGNNQSGSPALMLAPTGVAVDRSLSPNRIYITQAYQDNLVQAFSGDSFGEPNASLPYYDLVSRWGVTVPYGTEPGSGPDDLNYPSGIAVNGANAWVTELGNNRIHVYSGVPNSTLASPPTTSDLWAVDPDSDGYFRSAGAMAAAPDGSVFVVDANKYRIQHFSPKGSLIGAFGEYGTTTPDQFQSYPVALTIAANGEVLVSGTGYNGIQRFSQSGDYLGLLTWSGLSANPISPSFLDTDSAGNIFVWDWSVQKIVKLSSVGAVIASFGSLGGDPNDASLVSPNAIAVSPDGRSVYVLDGAANRVKKFLSTDGVTYEMTAVSSQSGTSGSGSGQLSDPASIGFDALGGRVAVADRGNSRVEFFDSADLSYAGQFGSFGMGESALMRPAGVEFDRWANMWLADTGNDRVKRLGKAPSLTVELLPAATTATSITINYSQTDPAAECAPASGAAMPLTVGANSFVITCTNAQGSDAETVSITRTVPDVSPPVAPVVPAEPTLKLAKKLKLTKSKKLKFSVTCPDGCTVNPRIAFGRTSSRLKQVRVGAKASSQQVTLKLSSKQYKKALALLKKRKKVTLTVTVQSYKATQGKTGKAAVAK